MLASCNRNSLHANSNFSHHNNTVIIIDVARSQIVGIYIDTDYPQADQMFCETSKVLGSLQQKKGCAVTGSFCFRWLITKQLISLFLDTITLIKGFFAEEVENRDALTEIFFIESGL